MTTIAIISNRQILTEGLRSVIAGMEGYTLSAVYPDHNFPADLLRGNNCPDLLVVELTPSITLDGLSELKSVAPGAALVLWFDTLLPEFAAQALRLGTRALLPKTSSVEIHADCLRRVANGGIWVENGLSAQLLSVKQTNLTRRERQLMTLLAQGLKNKEIAWRLAITEGTVKVYLSRLFEKVGANDRFDLALLALKNMSSDQSCGQEHLASPSATGCVPFVAKQFVTLPRISTQHD